MKNEPKALKEVHIIREEIYEETKGMTPAERAAYANAQAQLLINKYNLKLDYENKTKELAY
jgi:sRNA-binding carbon storage regulator CsrA